MKEEHALLLEGAGRYEPGQRLVLFALPVRLPPVGVLLVDHVQDVALQEGDAELPARDVEVVLRVIVKQCTHVHLHASIQNGWLGLGLVKKKRRKGRSGILKIV